MGRSPLIATGENQSRLLLCLVEIATFKRGLSILLSIRCSNNFARHYTVLCYIDLFQEMDRIQS
jgi:hypothetical protein